MRGQGVGLPELWLPSSVVEQRVAERLRAERQAPAAGIPMLGPRIAAFGLGTQPDKAALLRESKGWAAIAARAIVRRVQGVTFLAVERFTDEAGQLAERQLPRVHPLSELIARPNPVFGFRLTCAVVFWHLLQTGEAYLQVLRDGIGVPRELWPLPTQQVAPVFDPVEVVAGYEVRGDTGRTVRLPREDVVRVWDPDPLTLYSGMGALGPQAMEWDTDRFRLEHLREHFRNDALPRVVLESEADTPAPEPDEREAFERDWRRRYASRVGSARGVPAILPGGVTAHELSAHGGVSELSPLGEQSAKQILMAYGVPRSIVGDVVDANRAAAETNRYVFDSVTVEPLVALFEDAMTDQLAGQFDAAYAVSHVPFVDPDKEFELRREDQDLRTKVRTPQQVLRDRGADPDEAPWGEYPVGSVADAPYTGELVDFEDEEADDVSGEPDRAGRIVRTRVSDAADQDAAWKRSLATERRWLGRFLTAFASVLEAQRRDVVAAWLKANGERGPVAKHVAVSQLFDADAYDDLFELAVDKRVRGKLWREQAKAAADSVGGQPWSFTDAQARLVKSMGTKARKNINATTRRRIVATVEAGVANGDSPQTVAKALTTALRDRKRARTIARTELAKTAQAAQLEGFRSSGVVVGKRWNTSRDEKVRDSHGGPDGGGVDGQVVELDGEFTLDDGATCDYPLDPRLGPENVVNCRCFLTAVLED